jgi:hypothetical protein
VQLQQDLGHSDKERYEEYNKEGTIPDVIHLFNRLPDIKGPTKNTERGFNSKGVKIL